MPLEVNVSKAVSHFDMKWITQYSEKSRRINWTIEAVSKLPYYKATYGPSFVINNVMIKLLVIKLQNRLMICLSKNGGKSFKIDSNLVLLDCEGTKLQERIKQDEIIDGHTPIRIWEKLKPLKNDQLIIIFCFKTVEHVTEKLSPWKAPEEHQKKLLDDLKMIYNNPDGSDFKLHVGNNLIHAHKTILSLLSKYFKRMFETNMRENIQNSVLITDVSYSTMKNLVEFLYTGTFTMEVVNDFDQEVRNLYIAADKYQLIDLRALCADKLLTLAAPENILGTLQVAVNHNDESLKAESMNFISFHLVKILKSDAWKTFLLRDVDLASEITLFCLKKRENN